MQVMLTLILVDIQYCYWMLFLALKKIQIVKITPHQVPNPPDTKNYPTANFPIFLPPFTTIWKTLSHVEPSPIHRE